MKRNNNQGCWGFLFPSQRVDRRHVFIEDVPVDNTEITYPYEVSYHFLTRAEHSFYLVAKKLLGEGYMLCPQVSLSAVFSITDQKNFYPAFNRISRKRIDFIVCDATTMKILFGIELDDSSHQREDRKQRDEFVEKTFKAACLPLVRIIARQTYNTHDLKGIFNEVLNLEVDEEVETPEMHYENPFLIEVGVKEAQSEPTQKPDCCPNCGSPMKVRTSLAGPNVGHQFYVCIRYPECKTTIKIVKSLIHEDL